MKNFWTAIQQFQAAYLVLQGIEAFEDEFKHGVKVVRARRRYKDIRVSEKNVRNVLAKNFEDFFFFCLTTVT